MTIVKENNIITLTLNEEENNAVNYFMVKTNGNILYEYFNHFIQTRINTAALEQRIEVMEAFNKLSPEEQDKFLSGGL
jgi:hypothetical protein